MAWTDLTADLLRSALNNTELTAAQTVAQQGGQSDPITNQLGWVTALVRGYVTRAWPLEASGVPPALVGPALDIALYKLLARIAPQLAKERKDGHDQAMKILEAVAEGKINPDPQPGASGSTIEVVRENEREATRQKMGGL